MADMSDVVPSMQWTDAERLQVIEQLACRLIAIGQQVHLQDVYFLADRIRLLTLASSAFLQKNRATILKEGA